MKKTFSLNYVLQLCEEKKEGWENGKPEGKKLEGQKEPSKSEYEKPESMNLDTETPSGLNSLELPKEFVPGKDKDAKVMQLKSEIEKLEEVLLEYELEEAFVTPDKGVGGLTRSLFTGAALQPPNGYDKNFCPDPPAPEEGPGYRQDSSATIIAPQQFIPKEEMAKLARILEHNRRTRMAKLF